MTGTMEPLIYVARDVDDMATSFVGWQMDVVQQELGTFQGKLRGFTHSQGRINFYSAFVDRRVFANGHHCPGSVMFTFIECPTKCVWNGERVHGLKLFCSDAERGLDLDAGAGFTSFSVSLDKDLLNGWLRKEGMAVPRNWNFFIDFSRNRRQAAALHFRHLIFRAVHQGDFDLTEFKFALFDLLHFGADEHVKRIAINFVPIHEVVELIHRSIASGKEIDLERVVEFYDGPLRTFYYNFKKYTGCTPHRYIKNLRLTMVQKVLKHECPDATHVRDAAYQYGFRHLGQFSRDYSRMFGEMPSDTLKRLNVG